MTNAHFLDQVRRRTASVSVGASALRNQGAAGIVETSRNYFINEIALEDFFNALPNAEAFKSYLDKNTDQLKAAYKDGGQNWGAARKALNLFFRDVVYNRYLSEHFNLPADYATQNIALRHLEVPLDKDVGVHLMGYFKDLPKWKSIKELEPAKSDAYQAAALELAGRENIARVHLDLQFWRQPKNKD